MWFDFLTITLWPSVELLWWIWLKWLYSFLKINQIILLIISKRYFWRRGRKFCNSSNKIIFFLHPKTLSNLFINDLLIMTTESGSYPEISISMGFEIFCMNWKVFLENPTKLKKKIQKRSVRKKSLWTKC